MSWSYLSFWFDRFVQLRAISISTVAIWSTACRCESCTHSVACSRHPSGTMKWACSFARGCTVLHSAKWRAAVIGEANNKWKGDNAGYVALHTRLARRRGKADHCEGYLKIYLKGLEKKRGALILTWKADNGTL
jgi:hypothetical protein